MICLDERGPERANRIPGKRLVRAPAPDQAEGTGRPAARATHAADSGRRGTGDRFGASRPAPGEAFTKPYERRTTGNWVECLAPVNAWRPTDGQQV